MEKIYPEFDEEDDLYSGFNEFHPTLNTSNLIQEPVPRETKILQPPIPVCIAINDSRSRTNKAVITFHRLLELFWHLEEAFQLLLPVL